VFTGLIQTLGTFEALADNQVQITCPAQAASLIMTGLEVGDSVAVDGVCLTVVQILAMGFVAVVSPETLQRSTLAQTTAGVRQVNLETSLRVGSKLGGHFVTGHVDGMGQLQSTQQTATSWEMTFTTGNSTMARYIVPKGSVAVNGISLTVAECDGQGTWFKVAVIPHTYANTNLCLLQPGGGVNLEGDILGKYVEKFLRSEPKPDGLSGEWGATGGDIDPVNQDFLVENGYL
jgi:riboflavin synthase